MSRTLAHFFGGTALATVLTFASLHARAGERSTLPLQPGDRLIYVGIEADYSVVGLEEISRRLTEDLQLKLVGNPLRSLANAQKRIWALRTADPEATFKALEKGAKKAEFVSVQRLQATVLDSGATPFQVATARLIEGSLDRVWSAWVGPRGETMWLFHESRLTRKVLEKGLEKQEVRASFHHQAFDLACSGTKGPDFAALEASAAQKLDLLSSKRLEHGLSLDLYLRSVDSLLVIEHEGRMHVCPDFLGSLISADAPDTDGWSVTFQSEGYPFL